jgi:hypothetical protein
VVTPPPDVRLVRTDIAGFFGFAERGPLVDKTQVDPGQLVKAAVKLNSWNDFRLIFGGFLPDSYLAYAVRGFFATGGTTCYVVRVGAAASPPATAVIPLPAAMTSTQIAQLSSGVSAGQSQIQLDTTVTLSYGSSIAIGDPATSQQLTVTGIVDGQSITVQPALAFSWNAGDPVFALSGPAVASPITSIGAATTAEQTQITLDSSDVVGVGDLIAIGDPLTGECVSVMGVVDDQTITVQPALQSVYASGDPVYAVLGSALSAPVAVQATNLQIVNAGVFSQGDLVSVEGDGVSEIRVVVNAPTASTIQLGQGLQFPYATGAVVRKYISALSISAFSQGAWGNRIKIEITPLDPGSAVTHFSLRVTVDQGADPAQPVQQEFYPLLSLDINDPSPTPIYAPDVVNAASQLIQISPSRPETIPQGTMLLVNSGPLAAGSLYLEGGSDGAEGTASSNQDFQDALDVLGMVDEIAILCSPDAAGPPPQPPVAPVIPPASVANPCSGQATTSSATFAPTTATQQVTPWSMSAIQQAMLDQCTRLQYRVAVLDTPMGLQPTQALNWRNAQGYSGAAARFAALYYPWLQVPDELGIYGPNRTVPPCGHIAGAYAYTDDQFGVQKPPANVELQFVSDVELDVSSQQQGFLNPAGINAIRQFPGRGIRVWGARSLASLTQDPAWIYIHTRRLMSMIEESVEKATQWAVFRPNDDDLRRMLTHSLTVFLKSIWLTGGLQGSTPAAGYFVTCDSSNNPQSSIDAGNLVCQVGVAVAAPMEFLVFEMLRSVAGTQVVEA